MEIYRRCHIFERLLSLSASPSLPKDHHETILQLLFRSTYVGGSTTLITRCGLLAWLYSQTMRKRANTYDSRALRLLASRIYETSDQDRVNDWSKGTFVAMLDNLQISENLT